MLWTVVGFVAVRRWHWSSLQHPRDVSTGTGWAVGLTRGNCVNMSHSDADKMPKKIFSFWLPLVLLWTNEIWIKTSNTILNQLFPGQINTLCPGAGLDILSLLQDYPHSCNLWSAQGTDEVNLRSSVKHHVDTNWVNMILIKQSARQRWKGITPAHRTSI